MLKREEMADQASCWNKARDDEPVFVLLGRDLDAPGTIREWARLRQLRGKDIGDALTIANRIEAGHICCGHERGQGPPCCERVGEYNGYGSDGPLAFVCPRGCSCHD